MRIVFPIRLASSSPQQFEEDLIEKIDEPQKKAFPRQSNTVKPPAFKHEIPLFIIAGTQKSGSTVLAGYLAHHPNVSFASRKELHFFDKQSNYDKGISHYRSEFKINSNTLIMGEATPYYIASRKVCQRIAEHFPSVKMIVILREPVARAYSEYQMKVRRVKEQTIFYSLINKYLFRVLSCVKRYPGEYKKIEACLPNEVTEHGRYPKFTRAIRKMYESLSDWSKVIRNCFADKLDKMVCPLNDNTQENYNIDSSSFAFIQYEGQGLCHRNGTFWEEMENSKYAFSPKSCWQYYKEGHESVKTLSAAFHGEIKEFTSCLNDIPRSNKGNEVVNRVKQIDRAVSECIRVQGGISKQYFYRSLYVVQFYHCFKYIDSSQFLIIGNKELKDDPIKTMKMVSKFLEIPYKPIEAMLRNEQVETLINSKFPSFEKTTAWKIKSEYDPIPIDVEEYLLSFFQEYNDLLSHYLQRNFTSLW